MCPCHTVLCHTVKRRRTDITSFCTFAQCRSIETDNNICPSSPTCNELSPELFFSSDVPEIVDTTVHQNLCNMSDHLVLVLEPEDMSKTKECSNSWHLYFRTIRIPSDNLRFSNGAVRVVPSRRRRTGALERRNVLETQRRRRKVPGRWRKKGPFWEK